MNNKNYDPRERDYNEDDIRDQDEDDRYPDGWEEEELAEQELEEKAFLAFTCKCGAWQFNSKGDPVHVADCCCGAE